MPSGIEESFVCRLICVKKSVKTFFFFLSRKILTWLRENVSSPDLYSARGFTVEWLLIELTILSIMADFRIYKREKKSNKNKKSLFFSFSYPAPF